jgi:hypothetical protein
MAQGLAAHRNHFGSVGRPNSLSPVTLTGGPRIFFLLPQDTPGQESASRTAASSLVQKPISSRPPPQALCPINTYTSPLWIPLKPRARQPPYPMHMPYASHRTRCRSSSFSNTGELSQAPSFWFSISLNLTLPFDMFVRLPFIYSRRPELARPSPEQVEHPELRHFAPPPSDVPKTPPPSAPEPSSPSSPSHHHGTPSTVRSYINARD